MVWAPFTRQLKQSIFAIVIYNSNAAKDDNFEVFLNDTSIGTIDNNQNDFTGRIFVEPRGVSLLTPTTILLPVVPAFESNLSLNMSLLINGVNRLRINATQNNGNGNAGTVLVGYWRKQGSKYTFSRSLLSSSYLNISMSSGILFESVFSYP